MLSNIGVPGLILILLIALVIFGPKKLPELGRAFGETLGEFRRSTSDIRKEVLEDEDDKKPAPQLATTQQTPHHPTNEQKS